MDAVLKAGLIRRGSRWRPETVSTKGAKRIRRRIRFGRSPDRTAPSIRAIAVATSQVLCFFWETNDSFVSAQSKHRPEREADSQPRKVYLAGVASLVFRVIDSGPSRGRGRGGTFQGALMTLAAVCFPPRPSRLLFNVFTFLGRSFSSQRFLSFLFF